MRYECVDCGSVEMGEADCLSRAHKSGHYQFYDRDSQAVEEPGAGSVLYDPFADTELVEEWGP